MAKLADAADLKSYLQPQLKSYLTEINNLIDKMRAFVGILAAVLVKRNAGLLQTPLQSVRFFDPSAVHREFFSHFGPQDFMGPLCKGPGGFSSTAQL